MAQALCGIIMLGSKRASYMLKQVSAHLRLKFSHGRASEKLFYHEITIVID